MGTVAIVLLRVVIALSLAGSLFVQVWMMPIIWRDLEGVPDWLRATAITLLVLGILSLQVVAVCIWQLLTMVRRGSVFSDAAFRYVDIVIGAITAGSVIIAVIAVTLAPGGTAPGIVGLICGAYLSATVGETVSGAAEWAGRKQQASGDENGEPRRTL